MLQRKVAAPCASRERWWVAVAARARVLTVARVVGAAARVAGAAGHARRLDARRGRCPVVEWCALAGVWQTWVAVVVATA